jgi:hypothetical protein
MVAAKVCFDWAEARRMLHGLVSCDFDPSHTDGALGQYELCYYRGRHHLSSPDAKQDSQLRQQQPGKTARGNREDSPWAQKQLCGQ